MPVQEKEDAELAASLGVFGTPPAVVLKQQFAGRESVRDIQVLHKLGKHPNVMQLFALFYVASDRAAYATAHALSQATSSTAPKLPWWPQ